MRKALGRPTREAFVARLRDVAPEFRPLSGHDIPGSTWTFQRSDGDLRQWIAYWQHKHDDAFTVEVGWSRVSDEPLSSWIGSPGDAFAPRGLRFRLSAFWKEGDHWWPVADPPALLQAKTTEDYLRMLAASARVDVDAHRPRLQAAVEDAIGRIAEHALPYFARVRQWAAAEGP